MLTYVVPLQFLLMVQLTVVLVNTWTVAVGIATEGDIEVLKEPVAASQERFRGVGPGVDRWFAVKDNDTVCEVSGHDKVVLDDECGLLGVHDESLDDTRSNDTLLGVKVGAGLVNDVDISWDTQSQHNSNTLQFTTRQVLYFLVDEVVDLEGLVDVRLELGRQKSRLDLLEEELSYGTLELGCDLLGLHADVQRRNGLAPVGLFSTSKHATERGLSGPVFTHHDDDLRIGEFAGFYLEVEVAEGLLHGGIAKGTVLVGGEIVTGLSNAESKGLFSEAQVLGGNMTVEEDVDTLTDRRRQGHDTIDGRATVEDANKVGKVVQDRQIVLNDNDIIIWSQELSNRTRSAETLLDIQVRRRLVKHIDICLLNADETNGETLKLSTRKKRNLTVLDLIELCRTTLAKENSIFIIARHLPRTSIICSMLSIWERASMRGPTDLTGPLTALGI